MRRAALMAMLIVSVLLGGGAEEASGRYRLGTVKAASLMRKALLRHPSLSFRPAYARKVKCTKRLSRIRLKCKMSWVVGDSSYWGKGTIWITFPGHRPYWNYSYRVVRFNEYCAVLEGEDCTRTFVVR